MKFYIDFVEASSKGTELVADIAYDSGLLNNHKGIKKGELMEENPKSPKRQKGITQGDKIEMCLDSMKVKNELLLKVVNLMESGENKNLEERINRIEST